MIFHYLIAIGTNIEPRLVHVSQSIEAILEIGSITGQAQLLHTAPIGAANQPFINTTITLKSSLQPDDMMRALLKIETKLGRVRSVKWGNRKIDLDIILIKFNEFYVFGKSKILTVPHPEAEKRLFVLEPAAQIAGDWVLTKKNETVSEILEKLKKGPKGPQ